MHRTVQAGTPEARPYNRPVDLSIVFLGTAGAVPTAQRGTAAQLVRRGGDRILVDCGEGTQRQFLRSGIGLVDVDQILITHCHADHVLGLPGMLKTFALRAREVPLGVAGPAGLAELMASLRPVIGRLSYGLDLRELEAGGAIERDGFRMEAFATDHHVPSLGYALVEPERPGRFDLEAARRLGVPEGPLFGALQHGQPVTLDSGRTVDPREVVGEARPGRRVVFSGDTAPCKGVFQAAIGADVLVHEATFLDAEADRAAETGHTTAAQAARLAREAGVRLLALTHLSTRYFGREVVAEARAEFEHTVVPRDFDVVEVPLAERGSPTLVKAA
jgi:ribonuclease Z